MKWWTWLKELICWHPNTEIRCRHPNPAESEDTVMAWVRDEYDWEVVCKDCGAILEHIEL